MRRCSMIALSRTTRLPVARIGTATDVGRTATCWVAVWLLWLAAGGSSPAWGQPPVDSNPPTTVAGGEPAAGDSVSEPADRVSVIDPADWQGLVGGVAASQPPTTEPPPTTAQPLSFLGLLVKGGWFMLPIVLLSCLVVTIGLERLVALRAGRLLPAGLLKGLGELARLPDGLPVERAYQLCMQYPSAASAIARTMLLKVGRPQSEIEHAVQEASQREADRCYGRVRWLNLAAGIAPLLGLLGTVWGLIRAFYDTTQLGVAENRAEHLAQGIYEALVTTLAGLLVAIPAAILAHWFEDRIRNRFRDIDQLMFYLMTRIERYEGRQRFEHQHGELVATQREEGS